MSLDISDGGYEYVFSYLFWDPNPTLFHIPFIDRPVYWYSIFFAIGFFTAYYVVTFLLRQKLKQPINTDILAFYLFLGMLIGARLVHVLFYDSWEHYAKNPMRVFYTWEGGLSSHGGALGTLVALAIYWKRHKRADLSFLTLLDFLCVGAAFAGGFIRIGNFFNQEILGTPTVGWWAVWFGHPMDVGAKMPCHPVQLYEALFLFSCRRLAFSLCNKTQNHARWDHIGTFFLFGLYLSLFY